MGGRLTVPFLPTTALWPSHQRPYRFGARQRVRSKPTTNVGSRCFGSTCETGAEDFTRGGLPGEPAARVLVSRVAAVPISGATTIISATQASRA
jgi:hypothetical protein